MKMNEREKIGPVKGILVAVAAMWGIGALGVYILIRSENWLFLGDETVPNVLSLQVLSFYGAYFGAKFPSVVVAGFVVANTDVRRPYMTAFSTVFTFQILMFGITLLRWPWAAMPALPSAIPVVCEIANILLLTASAALGVLWHNLWNRQHERKNGDN